MPYGPFLLSPDRSWRVEVTKVVSPVGLSKLPGRCRNPSHIRRRMNLCSTHAFWIRVDVSIRSEVVSWKPGLATAATASTGFLGVRHPRIALVIRARIRSLLSLQFSKLTDFNHFDSQCIISWRLSPFSSLQCQLSPFRCAPQMSRNFKSIFPRRRWQKCCNLLSSESCHDRLTKARVRALA